MIALRKRRKDARIILSGQIASDADALARLPRPDAVVTNMEEAEACMREPSAAHGFGPKPFGVARLTGGLAAGPRRLAAVEGREVLIGCGVYGSSTSISVIRSIRNIRKSPRNSHQATSVQTLPQNHRPSGRTTRSDAFVRLVGIGDVDAMRLVGRGLDGVDRPRGWRGLAGFRPRRAGSAVRPARAPRPAPRRRSFRARFRPRAPSTIRPRPPPSAPRRSARPFLLAEHHRRQVVALPHEVADPGLPLDRARRSPTRCAISR
jgi:hypothetical protein